MRMRDGEKTNGVNGEGAVMLNDLNGKNAAEKAKEAEAMTEEEELTPKELSRKKLRVWKNAICMALSFHLLMGAFIGLAVIQSSVHGQKGTVGLGINFGCSVVCCFFLPPLMMGLFGCKWTLSIASVGWIVWMICNAWPSWTTIIIGNVAMGIFAGVNYASSTTYFTMLGMELSRLTREDPEKVIQGMFGFFFTFLLAGKSAILFIHTGR